MASLSHAVSILQGVPIAVQVFTIITAIPIAIYAYDWVYKERPFPGYPLISLDGKTPEESWINFPKETLVKGAQLCPDSPFQVASYTGPKLILPQKYAEEVRAAENVHFTKSVAADLPWSLPGFKAFKLQHDYDRVLPTVVRTKLTLSLNQLTKGIVEETLSVIEDLFGKQTRGGDWQKISIRGAAMQIVAQNTLRVMVGEKLCRDPELIDIHTRHASAVFAAGSEIRAFPTALWPIIHWFLPLPQQLRKQLKRADEIMGQEVRRREQEARTAIASGQKIAKFGDSVAWHVDVTNSLGVKNYDQTAGQLAFTMAALHNTSTVSTIFGLLQNSNIVCLTMIFSPLAATRRGHVGALRTSRMDRHPPQRSHFSRDRNGLDPTNSCQDGPYGRFFQGNSDIYPRSSDHCAPIRREGLAVP